jgi:hypothetical protein
MLVFIIRIYHDARSSEYQSFHSSITEESCLLGFVTTLLGDWSLAIRMNVHLHCEGFGLVYLFIHSVTYVTLDMSITDCNLQHNL